MAMVFAYMVILVDVLLFVLWLQTWRLLYATASRLERIEGQLSGLDDRVARLVVSREPDKREPDKRPKRVAKVPR